MRRMVVSVDRLLPHGTGGGVGVRCHCWWLWQVMLVELVDAGLWKSCQISDGGLQCWLGSRVPHGKRTSGWDSIYGVISTLISIVSATQGIPYISGQWLTVPGCTYHGQWVFTGRIGSVCFLHNSSYLMFSGEPYLVRDYHRTSIPCETSAHQSML